MKIYLTLSNMDPKSAIDNPEAANVTFWIDDADDLNKDQVWELFKEGKYQILEASKKES